VAALLAAMFATTTLAQPGAGLAQPEGGEAPNTLPAQARGLDVEEHVGQYLPMEVGFTNAEGKIVHVGDYFQGDKPAIVALVYYKCPVVCTVVMNRLAETMNQLEYTVGTDYRTLIFSVDPTEDTKLAAQTKLAYVSGYNRDVTPEVQAGWQFHVTDDSAARRLAEALGFRYRKLDTGAYSHPVALFIITPKGQISRYIYGFSYPARDMKLALMEASEGKLVRTVGDRMLSFCYMYDPKAGSYTLQAVRVMQIAGVLTVTALVTLVGGLFLSERLRRNRATQAASSAPNPGATLLTPTTMQPGGTPQ
jgi:protein SCO1